MAGRRRGLRGLPLAPGSLTEASFAGCVIDSLTVIRSRPAWAADVLSLDRVSP
jgi:hypothetical protein